MALFINFSEGLFYTKIYSEVYMKITEDKSFDGFPDPYLN